MDRATDDRAAGDRQAEHKPLAGIAVAAVGGVCLAVQARLNGQLGTALGDGIAAATISFGSGLVVLLVLVPSLRAGRSGLHRLRAALRGQRLRWWQCVGGVAGAWLVVSQGLTVGAIGVAVFTVAVVGGQTLSSLFVDRAGLGPAGAQPLNVLRIAGAALAVISVAVAVSDDLGARSGIALAVLPAVAGIGVAVQQALNGRVNQVSGAGLVATLVNFGVGTLALLVALGVDTAVRGLPHARETPDWWAFCGGLLGIVVILTAVAAVRLVGVLLVGLSTVSGQLLGALAVNAVAPSGGQQLSVTAVVGTAMTLAAAFVAAVPTLRGRQ